MEQPLSHASPEAAAGPLLTVLAGLPPESHPLSPGATVIGRSSDAGLQLKHPEISRRHCRITCAAGALPTVEDLGSRWGTKINGATLAANTPAPLQPGDRLHIGPVLVCFGPAATPDPAPAEAASRSAAAEPKALVLLRGKSVETVPLAGILRFGRGSDVEVVLTDPGISRQHARIEPTPDGFQVTDLRSRAGSLVNGKRFEKHCLVIGDQLQMGPFFFRFDGQALERTTGLAGVEIEARGIQKSAGPIRILDDVGLRIERGQFVAILGPSGSGKSSLLDALTGLRPADSGSVRFDGRDLYQEYERLRPSLGYVPQDDIVHRELTVGDALLFSARLRLPAGTPALEIEKLVGQTIVRLGLEARVHTPIHRLSGGQRKRVSVGVELLGRPAVLFLDEPTSGLDPAAEFKMMELLRRLADGGCTVVCTTHVMENVYLTDRLFIIASGQLVFSGSAQEARDHFGVQKLAMLYDRLEDRPATEWRDILRKAQAGSTAGAGAPLAEPPPGARQTPHPPRRAAALPVLLARQWAILRADWKNFLILFGQPLVIALLVAWVTDDVSLSLFFAYLATMWFGCSNSAQEIVKELPIYRRERMVGLSPQAYLVSKFSLFGALTALQGAFLYACLWAMHYALYVPDPELDLGVPRGLDGSTLWQAGGVVLTAYAAVGIGFALSAIARTTMQAVMMVPLVLIPQILFSGLVVETRDMARPGVFAVTNLLPSYAAQTMMDVGAFWKREITGGVYNHRKKAGDHLKDLIKRDCLARQPHLGPGEAMEEARGAMSMGTTYERQDFAIFAALKLLTWMGLGYVVAWVALRARERS